MLKAIWGCTKLSEKMIILGCQNMLLKKTKNLAFRQLPDSHRDLNPVPSDSTNPDVNGHMVPLDLQRELGPKRSDFTAMGFCISWMPRYSLWVTNHCQISTLFWKGTAGNSWLPATLLSQISLKSPSIFFSLYSL